MRYLMMWVALVAVGTLFSCVPCFASFTDFESFTTGVSVNGQGGWSSTGSWDEEVVDVGGNNVWRVSNASTGGSFGDMPFAPRPGGIPTDTVNDPVNSSPGSFAGESSTGATFDRFFAEFDFRSATGAAQTGLSITVSGDNGMGGRHGFFDLEDNGTGIDIITFDVTTGGSFVGPTTIASSLSYTDWIKIGIEVLFYDGADNDVVNYYLNDTLIHTGTSWEQFYTNHQAALHPNGVPIQTLIYRISGTAVPAVSGGGFHIDNVTTEVSDIPEPATMVLIGTGIAAMAARRKRLV